MMLSSKEKLRELIEFGNEIKEIINLWDPMGLMDFCPEDEYETEVKGKIKKKQIFILICI